MAENILAQIFSGADKVKKRAKNWLLNPYENLYQIDEDARRFNELSPEDQAMAVAGAFAPGLTTAKALPTRTGKTMGDAIAIASPNGRMSKAAHGRAVKQLSDDLFGPGGMDAAVAPTVAQPGQVEALMRQAAELRQLAARGMNTKKYMKEAARLEAEAAALGGQ